MSQVVSDANTGQRLLSARIARVESQEKLFLSLPHGLDLREGVSISVDDGEVLKSDFTTADGNGSYADFDLSEELVSSMNTGSKLAVSLAAANGNAIKLDISLAGFFDAYTLLSQQ